MRDREVIEREMFRAREDLEQSVTELKHMVQEKVDVKARARVAFERSKQKAAVAFERGLEKAAVAFEHGRGKAVTAFERGKDRTLLAIDGATGCYWHDDVWRVGGAGRVQVISRAGVQVLQHGEAFGLPSD